MINPYAQMLQQPNSMRVGTLGAPRTTQQIMAQNSMMRTGAYAPKMYDPRPTSASGAAPSIISAQEQQGLRASNQQLAAQEQQQMKQASAFNGVGIAGGGDPRAAGMSSSILSYYQPGHPQYEAELQRTQGIQNQVANWARPPAPQPFRSRGTVNAPLGQGYSQQNPLARRLGGY